MWIVNLILTILLLIFFLYMFIRIKMCVDAATNALENYINGRWVRRKDKVSKVFHGEYMQKKRPKVPRFLCSSYKNYLLGIISPTLWQLAWMDAEKSAIYDSYKKQLRRYLCYKRKLGKDGWKALYREYRIRKGNRYGEIEQ